jgi:hypothetical protein
MDLALQTAAPSNPVRGHVDRIEPRADGSCVLVGWVHDPENPDELLSIEIVEGTTVIAVGRTGGYRQDLKEQGLGDGFCGLTIALPERLLQDQQEHMLHLRVAGTDLAITPPIPVRKEDYAGCVDGMAEGVLSGWATIPADPAATVEVHILVDGTFVAAVRADLPRDDLPRYYGSQNCGFRWAIPPKFDDGQPHRIAVQIANTAVRLPKPVTYIGATPGTEPLAPWLTEIPGMLRRERRYMANIDEYYRASRLVIETMTADAAIYGGHAAHEFVTFLVQHFPRAYVGPLDRLMASPTPGLDSAPTALYILHMDLALFTGRCLEGAADYFFNERIHAAQPTIMLVESPEQGGGLDHLDLGRARTWCATIVEAAQAAGMIATLHSTLVDFFFGHPGFLLAVKPAGAAPAIG